VGQSDQGTSSCHLLKRLDIFHPDVAARQTRALHITEANQTVVMRGCSHIISPQLQLSKASKPAVDKTVKFEVYFRPRDNSLNSEIILSWQGTPIPTDCLCWHMVLPPAPSAVSGVDVWKVGYACQ